jgi:hypothetical protein
MEVALEDLWTLDNSNQVWIATKFGYLAKARQIIWTNGSSKKITKNAR